MKGIDRRTVPGDEAEVQARFQVGLRLSDGETSLGYGDKSVARL